MKRTHEEELCGMVKEGRCVAGQELEKARQVIRELRDELMTERKLWVRKTGGLEKALDKTRDEVEELKDLAYVKGARPGLTERAHREGIVRDFQKVSAQNQERLQTIRSLQEELEDNQKAWAEETRALEQCEKDAVKADEEIARLDAEIEAHGVPDEEGCKAARVEAAKLRADVDGLQLELEAVRVAKDADCNLLEGERNEARASLQGAREVWKEFIADCAALLGLPKLEGCSEYGGGSIRHGIEDVRKKMEAAELTATGVAEGSAEWEDDAKTAQREVKELRKTLEVSQQSRTGLAETITCYAGALEKINALRNDIIGRQHVNWSKHIYPLVAALNEAGFEGAAYEKAREKVKATIKAAREMAAGARCPDEMEGTEVVVALTEEFAEILFPFLDTLEFYARLGNWQGSKADAHESACDRDLGGRARATLGRPDRDVPEIIGDDDEEARDNGHDREHCDCAECKEFRAARA